MTHRCKNCPLTYSRPKKLSRLSRIALRICNQQTETSIQLRAARRRSPLLLITSFKYLNMEILTNILRKSPQIWKQQMKNFRSRRCSYNVGRSMSLQSRKNKPSIHKSSPPVITTQSMIVPQITASSSVAPLLCALNRRYPKEKPLRNRSTIRNTCRWRRKT